MAEIESIPEISLLESNTNALLALAVPGVIPLKYPNTVVTSPPPGIVKEDVMVRSPTVREDNVPTEVIFG